MSFLSMFPTMVHDIDTFYFKMNNILLKKYHLSFLWMYQFTLPWSVRGGPLISRAWYGSP